MEIPVIQRDYAQGREDERSQEVRRRFLNSLFETLRADSKALDLDFIYGRWTDSRKSLEPLDGQQRLTTLFLLHWYLANHDDAFAEFQSWITHSGNGSCFTYNTRPAAREFFDALVFHPMPRGAIDTNLGSLSKWLADSVWFVKSWRRDPTVSGCLTMLDDIHKSFALSQGCWTRLTSVESPAITFRLLLLENFDLSDDLYIKMNARGKALTSFEVLKAEMERFVEKEFVEEPCPYHTAMNWPDYISRQFDVSWTNFLWKHRGASTEVDARFMQLIRALAIVRSVDLSDNKSSAHPIDQLLKISELNVPLLRELRVLDRTFIEQIVSVLDTLAQCSEAPNFLGRIDYMNEEAVFRRVLLAQSASQEDGLRLNDWVMFYAWCTFLLRHSNHFESDRLRASFHEWIRIVSNLTNNSDIDRNERLVAALRGVAQLGQDCGFDFLSRVADGALGDIGGFSQRQQRDEQVKAVLILRNPSWRPLIERAETHPYFRGDIGFLTHFSGISDRVSQTRFCHWTDEEDGALRQSFSNWYDRACAIFPEGATAWPAPFEKFLWERALLATGNYLLLSKSNWSFLDEKSRDASWKRLLSADTRLPDRDVRRDVVRQVLARIDPQNVTSSLQAIVEAGVQGDDTAPLPGFRSSLVGEPRLIEYCKRRMLRLADGSAFLLVREKRSGAHVDLYIYDLYLRLLDRSAELAPFTEIKVVEIGPASTISQVILSTIDGGSKLKVEKHKGVMQFHLQFEPGLNPNIAARLTDWSAEGETRVRHVAADFVEMTILELVASISNRSLTG